MNNFNPDILDVQEDEYNQSLQDIFTLLYFAVGIEYDIKTLQQKPISDDDLDILLRSFQEEDLRTSQKVFLLDVLDKTNDLYSALETSYKINEDLIKIGSANEEIVVPAMDSIEKQMHVVEGFKKALQDICGVEDDDNKDEDLEMDEYYNLNAPEGIDYRDYYDDKK